MAIEPAFWRRCTLALASVAAAWLVTSLIPALHTGPFSPFFAAVVVTAAYGGLIPALAATVLSSLVLDYAFLRPAWSFAAGVEELVRLGVFVTLATVVSGVEAARRRAERELKRRLLEQQAVAELGHRALTATSRDLMDHLARRIAEVLGVEHSEVLELEPDGKRLRVVAGVGWRPGVVGHATVGAARDSQAGYTLGAGKPVIVEDLRSETRFSGPPLLHEHEVVSGVTVIIHGYERPFGVLGAHSTRRRAFSAHEVHLLEAAANVLWAAIERERTEESRARLAAIVHSSRDAIIGETLDGTITSWSPGAEALYGYKAHEVLGHSIAILAPPDRSDEIPRLLEQLRRGEHVDEAEAERLTKDGRQITVSMRISPVRDAAGGVLGAATIARNVTARKRREAELRESLARHRAVLDTALDAIVTIDHAGRIVEFNPAAEKIFGYTRDEAVGGEMAERLIPPALRADHRHGLAGYLSTGEGPLLNRRIEMTAMRKDGSLFPVELAVTRLGSADPPLFTAFLRDITDRRRAAATDRRAEALRSATRLANAAAHEINNPLFVIMGTLELLATDLPADERTRQRLQNMLEASRRIKEIVARMGRLTSLEVLEVGPGLPEMLDLRKSGGPDPGAPNA
ncbi:MAG TPA: PAS domain S-box protein [Methylomirabilota bacterium]|nr:PAS domain S-box protein [Methylomirabilota bacterium]